MSTKLFLASTLLACGLILWLPPAWAQEAPELPEGKVEAQLDSGADTEIEQRLRATFTTLRELEQVEVAVEAGVVRLMGSVESPSARELAGELALKIQGITAVENDIEEIRSVPIRVNAALERFDGRISGFIESLPLFGLALAAFAVALLVARLVGRWRRPFRWLTHNIFLQDLSQQAVRVGIVLVGALLALEILDATALVGAVLGAAGVAGLAIGFAFRDLVENYIASILLSLRQPFAPGDVVQIENHLGHVARLTSRATILVTPDGNHVRIPNGVVFKATIENLTKKPERRFSFRVGVGNAEDLVTVQDLGIETLIAMEGVLEDPAPFARIEELGDSSVVVSFFGWVDQRQADFGKVQSEAIRLVKQAFDQRQVDMPEPTYRLRTQSPTSERAEPTQSEPAPTLGTRDISPDRHVEELVREERASTEPDLLSTSGEIE